MDEIKLKYINPFDELTITDDFMFGAVMSEPKHLKPSLENFFRHKDFTDHTSLKANAFPL